MTIDERHEKRQRWAIVAMVGALAVAVVLNLVLVLRPDPFDPLTFETQTVQALTADGIVEIPTVEGFTGPAIRVGEIVPVRVVYTVDSVDPVDVTGTVIWYSTDPSGIRCPTPIEQIPNVLQPGPHADRFENEVPPCVIDVMDRRGEPIQWTITGLVEVNHPNGVDASWSTEPFWLVP